MKHENQICGTQFLSTSQIASTLSAVPIAHLPDVGENCASAQLNRSVRAHAATRRVAAGAQGLGFASGGTSGQGPGWSMSAAPSSQHPGQLSSGMKSGVSGRKCGNPIKTWTEMGDVPRKCGFRLNIGLALSGNRGI